MGIFQEKLKQLENAVEKINFYQEFAESYEHKKQLEKELEILFELLKWIQKELDNSRCKESYYEHQEIILGAKELVNTLSNKSLQLPEYQFACEFRDATAYKEFIAYLNAKSCSLRADFESEKIPTYVEDPESHKVVFTGNIKLAEEFLFKSGCLNKSTSPRIEKVAGHGSYDGVNNGNNDRPLFKLNR